MRLAASAAVEKEAARDGRRIGRASGLFTIPSRKGSWHDGARLLSSVGWRDRAGGPGRVTGGSFPAEDCTVAASHDVRLFLLDGFELRRTEVPVPPVPLAVQRLVAFLALHERPLHRLHVAASLWPDTTEEKARASLRSTVWRLRLIGDDVLSVTATHMRLAGHVWVDVREAVAAARRLVDGSGQAVDSNRLALSGDLLADWYDDWVLIERERVRQLRLHALEALCGRLTATGRFAEAIDAGLLAVASEPLRESAQVALIRAHLEEGNRIEAVRQYERYRRLLEEELGVEPGFSVDDATTRLALS